MPASNALEVRSATLLEREASARPISIPPGMKDLEPGLQRLSARIRACGLEDPFRGDVLKAIPSSSLRSTIAEARRQGLLDDGPAWTQRGDQVQGLADTLRKTLNQELELDRTLPSGHGRGI
jgi:hypothetical protein